MKSSYLATALLIASAGVASAQVSPFSYLDPAYTAKIVSNSIGGNGYTGIAFGGGKVYRTNFSSPLQVLDPSMLFSYHGDNLYTPTALTVDVPTNAGSVIGSDGYLYAQTSSGVRRYDLTSGASVALPGSVAGNYGIKQTALGDIVYNANDGWVHQYNLSTNTDTPIYFSGTFNDDLAVGPNNIFVAALGNCTIRVLDNHGAFVNSVGSPNGHCADGAAFANGDIFANNTDRTITRYTFASGLSGGYTETLIAAGNAGYDDFAAAGPDGAFYVTRDSQIYSDGFTESGRSLIRLELATGGGFGTVAPEPASIVLLATGLAGVFGATRRKRGASFPS